MRAILHIGMEKTGTTSLQAALAASRSVLEDAGFCYSRAAGKQAHIALPLFAARESAVIDLMAVEGLANSAALERYRVRFRRRLAIEVGRRPDTCFIFSSEHCHSRLVDDMCVQRLHGLLAPLFDHIEIIVYLRRQDRAATSFYSTYLRGGGTSADVIPPPIAADYFDYAAMLARWTTVFGNCVKVVPYDAASGDIVRDFADRIGLPPLVASFSHEEGLNQSISAAVQEALRQFSMAASGARHGTFRRAQETLIVANRRHQAGLPGRRPARDRAQRFAASFAESNALVEQRYLAGQRLFDDSFAEYPEHELPIDAGDVYAVFTRALLRLETARAGLGEENRHLHQSVAIAATGNEQLRDALDRAAAGNRELDRLLTHERAEQRRLQAELGYYAGLVHFDAGRLETARDLVSGALNIDSEHAALWHLLARIHHAAGRCDEALAAIDQASHLDPDNPVHRDMRASFVPPLEPELEPEPEPEPPPPEEPRVTSIARLRWFARRP